MPCPCAARWQPAPVAQTGRCNDICRDQPVRAQAYYSPTFMGTNLGALQNAVIHFRKGGGMVDALHEHRSPKTSFVHESLGTLPQPRAVASLNSALQLASASGRSSALKHQTPQLLSLKHRCPSRSRQLHTRIYIKPSSPLASQFPHPIDPTASHRATSVVGAIDKTHPTIN